MAKIRIPLMVQDPGLVDTGRLETAVEGYDPVRPFFLSGPVTDRVAVLDFDPDSGAQVANLRYEPGVRRGRFENAEGEDLYRLARTSASALSTPEFMQVSVFGTVLRTIDQFERGKPDDETQERGLGRSIRWAFDGPQLLVVPRAGKRANAYYDRSSHSLQFFYFPSRHAPDQIIHSCLSRDIVAHETGHAIIDGVAPDLLDAYTPQSLAIHEALADLTALLVAFSSHTLRGLVLQEQDGSIANPSHFTFVAEEFGMARGHRHGLRNLVNRKSLDPNSSDYVSKNEPHDLSEVLSGALYQIMTRLHEAAVDELAPNFSHQPNPRFSASGQALAKAAERFKQITFRALDYMPPGEVSFADYGRALIAVDRLAYPADTQVRDWLREQFLERKMVPHTTALAVQTALEQQLLVQVDVPELHHSDWAAYEFARNNRKLLNIPPGISFEIQPRLEVTKKNQNGTESHECIFKVSWSIIENNDLCGPRCPPQRRLVVGTTLVLDWTTGRLLSRLTSAPPVPDYVGKDTETSEWRLIEYEEQRLQRSSFLRHLMDEDLLRIGDRGLGPDGQPLHSAIHGEVVRGILRIRGTANMLHIVGGD